MNPRTHVAELAPDTRAHMHRLLDLLGRRWTLRIVWELRAAPLSSRALAARCGGVSPTVLHKRLRELRDESIVELVERGYELSARGIALIDMLRPLEPWARRWVRA